ncbi:hypothetical protein [Prevotella sp. 10(H)]|uniref:hypothetical protein n=1 Tax=Prevotella sp. 10(H) TaxID=1158294 RepID=UPI0004A764DC|nr:hypothetical protein [Prevotella sp. 10(H)]
MKAPNSIRAAFFVLFSIFLISCSNNEADNNPDFDNTFPGYYKIVSITSERGIDMNNDGRETIDLISEMRNYKDITVTLFPLTFDPDSPGNYAEIRPLPGSANNVRLIDFRYPYQVFVNEEEGDYTTLTYLDRFTNYSYDYDSDKQIKIIDNNSEFNSKYGKVNSLMRINEDSFKVDLTINIYNFKKKAWAEENLDIIYTKVKNY